MRVHHLHVARATRRGVRRSARHCHRYRGRSRAIQGRVFHFDISGNSFPAELGTVDTIFVQAEAKQQIDMDILLLLEKRATELGRPDVAYLPFELEQRSSPFVGCWMRGCFMKQLMAVKDATKCPELAGYLSLLQQISVVRGTG